MLLLICGPSCSGKSSIAREIVNTCPEASEIVMTTTREKRRGEVNGKDYHFLSVQEFKEQINDGSMVYSEEYSGERFYGIAQKEINSSIFDSQIHVLVTTPGGIRSIKRYAESRFDYRKAELDSYILSFAIQVPLGVQVKRYIDRCGAENFTFNDMNEISARVNRDFGMFLGIEKEVNGVFVNDESKSIQKIAEIITMIASGCLQSKTEFEDLENEFDEEYPEDME